MAKIQSGQKSLLGSSNLEPLLPPLSPGLTPKTDPSMTPEMGPRQSQPREADLRSECFGSTRELLSDKDWYAKLVGCGVSSLVAKAQIRHRRDLPELLHDHHGAWVAYKGDERLEIGSSKTSLYRKYLDQGLGRDELLVLCVEPDLFDDELDFPLPT